MVVMVIILRRPAGKRAGRTFENGERVELVENTNNSLQKLVLKMILLRTPALTQIHTC
jgi:hypothetical protein